MNAPNPHVRNWRPRLCYIHCTAALLLVATSHATVLPEGFQDFDMPGARFSPTFSEHGTLPDPGGFLYSPICNGGGLLSPPLMAELPALIDGYPGTRIIDRGGGRYWLAQPAGSYLLENPGLRSTVIPPGVYGELQFHPSGKRSFTLPTVSLFNNGHAGSASTCMA